jgi:hypothetical protein
MAWRRAWKPDRRGEDRPVDATRTTPDRSSRITRREQVHDPGVYLFPDHPTTLEQLRQLQADPATRVSFIAQVRERTARQD